MKLKKMCDEAVHHFLGAVKFIPDWIAQAKCLKSLMMLYSLMMIHSFSKVTFFAKKWVFSV